MYNKVKQYSAIDTPHIELLARVVIGYGAMPYSNSQWCIDRWKATDAWILDQAIE
jgi:hypothetical protein